MTASYVNPNRLDPVDFPTSRAYKLATARARSQRRRRESIRTFHRQHRRVSLEEVAARFGTDVNEVREVLDTPEPD